MKVYRYLVRTSDSKLYAIKSTRPLEVTNEKQMQWVSRECDNKIVSVVIEVK